ncbi:phage tail sheath protein [Pseudogulbenkiania sp. NH8B]|uniref:phage tail sheath subtilisin-like domain-containing protein n=1 Tax=Pseudogulbenkiania sp. (strain NH8B) TaxID=748280 RepID=UPI00022794FA|nr:phage tail sheath subtilisin-like domain-containing protein [Pseudogulbenkiania sp. NH8B]BAK75386.1 phage tail sheath protein [Pseudogulbenkiania sp. NH8B]
MPANFLHGVETTRIARAVRAIFVVKSAVIALLGCAPTGPVNASTLCLTETDGAAFGPTLDGFNIPDTLDAIYDQGAGTVIVINVLDPAVHKTAVANEAAVFDAATGRLKTAHPAIAALVVKSSDGNTTYTEGTDYTVTPLTGEIVRVAGGQIAAGATSVKLSYDYADPSKVTPADLIGAIDGVTGKKTGMKLLPDTYQRFGFFPKILIAPGYASLASVSSELIAWGDKLSAKALIDAPIGTTRDQAVAMRGPTVENSPFNTSSRSAILCYPHVKVYDSANDSTKLQPLSARLAGVMAAKDLDKGYWWSPSNTEIKGIVGLELDLSARIDDPQSDVNLLNEVGIVTVFNSFGSGFRVWGNRQANFPSETGLTTFIPVTRTQDVIDESIRYFSLQYIDQPISQALIDAIVESINQFLRKLKGDGALLDGICWYDPARQTEAELANGHAIFSYKFTPPPPFERGTYESELTSEYLVNLKGA